MPRGREERNRPAAQADSGRQRRPTPSGKRPPGRPPRQDNPQRIAVLIPGDLKRWLRIRAAEQGRDMGDIVTEALEVYRSREH